MPDTPPLIDADWLRRPATQAVFAALAVKGHVGRVVGGAVRNALIGKPVADIDIATPAAPDQVIAAAEAAGLAVVPTGLKHGTVTVLSAHVPHEVTTLRRDVETDGRHAIVAFTDDWAADAARRDFTINALYCDAAGRVHDPLGGYADLVARRVRFIGDPHARIREDYLRILRFFRFTAEYAAGPIDADGLAACGRLREGLQRLSAERIRTEVLKIIVAPRAPEIVQAMHDHGYWVPLLGLAPVPEHLARLAAQAPSSGAMQRLAALCIVTQEDASRLFERLRLSLAEHEALSTYAWLLGAVTPALSARQARRFMYAHGRDFFREGLDIAAARRGDDPRWGMLRDAAAAWARTDFPLRGRDLVERGMQAGPVIGETLGRLEAWWIERDFAPTRDELLARIEEPPQSSGS